MLIIYKRCSRLELSIMNKKIAIILEGASREVKYWHNIQRTFFHNTNFEILTLSAGVNIYTLWKKIKLDNFETDIIEILKECDTSCAKKIADYSRDSFEEVFLFFDYDPQQNNLRKEKENPVQVIADMFNVFDNETENGKLYMSYPMSEALRDVRVKSCIPLSMCKIPFSKIKEYKQITGSTKNFLPISNFSLQDWNIILAIFLLRVRCLYQLNLQNNNLLRWYKKGLADGIITPLKIYEKEHNLETSSGEIFILSAFSQFLLDYFKPEFFTDTKNLLENFILEECKHLIRHPHVPAS